MASKYAKLKGRIPEGVREPSEKETAIAAHLAARQATTLADLIAEYTGQAAQAEKLAAETKIIALLMEALERLIRQRLDAMNADGLSSGGFTWSTSYEPYPVVLANDVPGIVQYFKDHGMEDQLALKASEVAARLKSFVKEEALNNELEIGTREVPDPRTGEPIEVPDVRSKIPGVRVFLKAELSRVKSGKRS